MNPDKSTLEQMWARQQIKSADVDYKRWDAQKEFLRQLSRVSQSCVFAVDVYKGVYDFASAGFADIFGFSSSALTHIDKEGDLLEEYIHPDDRQQLLNMQISHSEFIYSLPPDKRNDFTQSFQFRMLNRKKEYINVISRQKVLLKDANGKAWIVMGVMDISPDQQPTTVVKRSVLNLVTGEMIHPSPSFQTHSVLTQRETEILNLIKEGLLSKEIACKLGISIYTIHNHRKSILAKLQVDNMIEAINKCALKSV